MYNLTQEERRMLHEECITQEESDEIDRILDNIHTGFSRISVASEVPNKI
jgi:hypothetical protein